MGKKTNIGAKGPGKNKFAPFHTVTHFSCYSISQAGKFTLIWIQKNIPQGKRYPQACRAWFCRYAALTPSLHGITIWIENREKDIRLLCRCQVHFLYWTAAHLLHASRMKISDHTNFHVGLPCAMHTPITLFLPWFTLSSLATALDLKSFLLTLRKKLLWQNNCNFALTINQFFHLTIFLISITNKFL